MKIPQLFVKAGNNRFIPVSSPIDGESIYFWDESVKKIVPAEDRLYRKIIQGCQYFILKSSISSPDFRGINLPL